MSLRINQNVLSIKTYSNLVQTNARLEKSIQKLSSGLRINSAADDAAGLAISEKMRRQIRGLNRAVLNAQDGISMIQTAEGALGEAQSLIQRMRELAIQASNDTLTSNDRLEIQKEVNQLRTEIDRISQNTEFNTKKLLNGSQSALVSSNSRSVQGMVTGAARGSGDYNVSIALISGGISQMQRSQVLTTNNGQLADGSTRLEDISQFYDSNGNFSLSSPQQLTITGNAENAQVTIDARMSLDELAAALQQALSSSNGLGMRNSSAGVVSTATSGIAGMGGYIQIVSGSIGEQGDFSVAGPQSIMDALGFAVTRESANNLVQLTLTDGMGNVNNVRTSSDRAIGLLDGVDLYFNPQAAQIAGVGGLQSGLRLTADQTFTISAGGSQVDVTVAAGDWTMEGIARSINSQIEAVGVEGLKASVADGEVRLSYEPPTSTNTSTIKISAADAEQLGILDGTSSGFVQGDKDQSKVINGFTIYHTAGGTAVTFTIGDGEAAGTAVNAYTTTNDREEADMREIGSFVASVNSQLAAADVQVRLDAVNGSLAFTATRVGQENKSDGSAVQSRVTLEINDQDALNMFGLTNGTAKGSGDTNFRLHVVDNKPQFQVGADQGQNMRISVGDMSARALGIDKLDMTSVDGAQSALAKLNKALDTVSSERSKLGAFQNRLEHLISNLRNTSSNLTAAESRIRDADIASEMIEFTRNQIVSQSGTAMLAQANMVPQSVLSLLGQ